MGKWWVSTSDTLLDKAIKVCVVCTLWLGNGNCLSYSQFKRKFLCSMSTTPDHHLDVC
jgi:hypothetical protein